MSLTVTASQSGTGAEAGMALTVKVLTGQAASPAGTAGNSGTLTTPQQAITPAATGSWVYGAVTVSPGGGGVAFTPDAAATFSYNAANTAAGSTWSFGTYRSTATTTAATPVTLGATAPTSTSGQTGLAQCEIEAGAGLAEDSSAPVTAVTTAATSVTTASFTPPPGSLLVAMADAHATGTNGQATTLGISDTSGLTWAQQAVATVSAGGTGSFQVAAVWTALVPADAGVTAVPQRYGQAAPPSPVPWAQKDRRNALTVATAADPLPSPLDTAWQAGARYSHLYNDSHLRDRRQYFTQRLYVSQPGLLTGPAQFDPVLAAQASRQAAYGMPAQWRTPPPQPRQWAAPDVDLTTAQLENELLGGAGAGMRYLLPATHADRREVPQQRACISDPSAYPAQAEVGAGTTEAWWGADTDAFWRAQRVLVSDPSLLAPLVPFDPVLGGQDDLGRRWRQAAAHCDRREVPTQRAYISDPSFYPTTAPAGPLTVAWGAGGPYWHLYNRAASITDRREVPQQRAYVSDPLLLATALLENELLGGAQTWMHYVTAAHYDRREVPQQRPYISDPSAYPSGAVTDPLTVAWGAGGGYWHLYNRAADLTGQRAYPAERLHVSDPLLLTTAQLENELLGGAGAGMRYLLPATHADRREVPQQRAALQLLTPPVPLDPVLAAWADLGRRYGLAATHADRRLVPAQRLYFPVPLPPVPVTYGTATPGGAVRAIATAGGAATQAAPGGGTTATATPGGQP